MSSACRSQVRQLELDRARRIYGRAIAECQKATVARVTTCFNMLQHVITSLGMLQQPTRLFEDQHISLVLTVPTQQSHN